MRSDIILLGGELSDYSINVVRKNAKRMLTLVNQLLDIRTIVSGKMNLKVSQFDVVKLVNDVYDDFRDMAAERQMDMRIIKSVDSLIISADSIRMEAIVYNLMSNAFKYTSDGGKIEVGVLYREGDSDFRIMVKDNGIGVPDEKRTARFACVIACAMPDGRTMTSYGAMEGRIAYEIKGENGFGYDPILYLPECGCTSAELTLEQKNELSHRGKALRLMKEKLAEIL